MNTLEQHYGAASFYTAKELNDFLKKEGILEKDIDTFRELDYPTEYSKSIFHISFYYYKPKSI